jgi:hypothetical protein
MNIEYWLKHIPQKGNLLETFVICFLWGRGEEVRTTLWIINLSFQLVFIREAVVEIKSGKKRFMVRLIITKVGLTKMR